MTFSTQTQYLEYFPEVRDQRWLFFCAWYIIYCFYACTLQGPGTKKGFRLRVCDFLWNFIPRYSKDHSSFKYHSLAQHIQNFVCQQKIVRKMGLSYPTHLVPNFHVQNIEFWSSDWKNLTSKAISVDASHWSAYESGIADFCNPVSWENPWVGPVLVCLFFLVTRTWRKNRANWKIRNLRNMAENHANNLGRNSALLYIYGIVHLFFHFG